MTQLFVVGVRHHSPACARLVQHVIRRERPAFVLIEGPVDMNGRMDEMLLGHDLPIAIFSYAHGDDLEGGNPALHHASWSPFCAYSPEWVAINEAKASGAEALFIDLPAWDEAFLDVENRYSDRHTRTSQRMQLLCQRMGVEDTDALWDHLFEQPLDVEQLEERLTTYFRELRAGDQSLGRDITREAYMSRWVAWAMREAEKQERHVIVVCGGYHAPMLEENWKTVAPVASEDRPAVPARAGAVRTGSYLVPYSFRRLDSFVGYESGMPSPEFYQRVWEVGALPPHMRGEDDAGEQMLFAAIDRLRKKKQRVSPADAIAAMTLARGLRTLRGHQELARVDVLDGLAAAVVKDALDAPLPWNRRGTLLRGTDPMLVEIVAAFSGDRIGKLAQGTPHPPLVADAFKEIERVGLSVDRTKKDLTITLTETVGLAKSRVLHRLRVLQIPGFTLTRSPTFDRDRTALTETWSLVRMLEQEPALIEAAAYGATLEAAAAAKLEDAVAAARGMSTLAKQLREATLVGIGSLASRLAEDARRAAGVESSFGDLGEGLAELVALHEHDVLFGARDAPLIGEAIRAGFDRGLWLFEGIEGEAGEPEVRGALALRDALKRAGNKLGLDGMRAESVMARRAADVDAPPPIRGAAFGFVWSVAGVVDPTDATRAVKSAGKPETLGDFLAGLFALAREEIVNSPELLHVVDGLISPMTREEFLIAIPSLRMAFAWFPPREKEQIARMVLAHHSGGEAVNASDVRKLVKLDVHPDVTLLGLKFDGEVEELVRRFGLKDALDGAPPEEKPS